MKLTYCTSSVHALSDVDIMRYVEYIATKPVIENYYFSNEMFLTAIQLLVARGEIDYKDIQLVIGDREILFNKYGECMGDTTEISGRELETDWISEIISLGFKLRKQNDK